LARFWPGNKIEKLGQAQVKKIWPKARPARKILARAQAYYKIRIKDIHVLLLFFYAVVFALPWCPKNWCKYPSL